MTPDDQTFLDREKTNVLREAGFAPSLYRLTWVRGEIEITLVDIRNSSVDDLRDLIKTCADLHAFVSEHTV